MWRYAATLFAALMALPVSSSGALPGVRPALLRMRIILTTESHAADLTFDSGTIINASVVSGARAVQVRAERNHLSFTHDGDGPAETHVRLLVSGVRAGSRVRWRLTLSSSDAPTQIEVYNENEQGRARLVDRFDTSLAESTFESPADRLLAGGPLRIGSGPRPLVLAFFYPWYQHFNWSSEKLLDQPLYLYSTDLPDDVARSLAEARAAGLDGVIVSWRGDTDWNDRRLQIVLDRAQRLGLTVSILVETIWTVGVRPDGTKRVGVDIMRQWLEKASDVFAGHPAFLKIRGRPVIFVYIADTLTLEDWRAIVQSLRRSGHNLFLMADTLDLTYLESFSGAFTYSTVGVPQANLERFYADQALRTESYNLSDGGERRVSAATVSPGYDDRRLDRTTTFVVDRANGALYEAQWQAAAAAQPDWILVTTWNEFWENTYIEPSVQYGHRYQARTRGWSELFRRQELDSRAPLARPQAR